MIRGLWAFVRRWLWLVCAAAVAVVFYARRRRSSVREFVAPFLRRAHEADVDRELAKRRIDKKAEEEIRTIRSALEERIERIELERVDRAAKLARKPDELLDYYRRRSVELLRAE